LLETLKNELLSEILPMIPTTKTLILSLLLNLFGASIALCASVTAIPYGGGIYSIQGSNMNGVAGIELNIGYDAASLGTPKVVQGALVSGALMQSNTAIPGTIKVAIIRVAPFSGSGEIASISFTTQTGSGGITSITSSMIDNKGTTVASQASVAANTQTADSGLISTPGVPFSQPTATTTTSSTTSTTATPSTSSTSMPSVLGTVTMPSDASAKSDTKPTETTIQPQPAVTGEPVADKSSEQAVVEKPAVEPQKQEKVKVTVYVGILENFRVYKGEKTPGILTALFNKEIAPNISQEPAIAINDGKNPVKILVKLEIPDDKSPNFALNGAKLVSLSKDNTTGWVIEALPHTGIIEASLTILTDNETIEYPLTLTPASPKTTAVDADFVLFLKDSKRDLNGDGKHDYLDDYIYTANYLLKNIEAANTKN
jgi:hypothetical protein